MVSTIVCLARFLTACATFAICSAQVVKPLHGLMANSTFSVNPSGQHGNRPSTSSAKPGRISASTQMHSYKPRTPWGGAPATLIRKTPLVHAADDRLPVYTLTFKTPPGMDFLGVDIPLGDVVKVCVPNYKPKSYSVSAQRPGEFDITLKVFTSHKPGLTQS